MEMAPREGVAELEAGLAEVESVAVGAVEEALAEECQGSAGPAAGDIQVRANPRVPGKPIRAVRSARRFTPPFAGNPRVRFRKPWASDPVTTGPVPISRNITSSICLVTC